MHHKQTINPRSPEFLDRKDVKQLTNVFKQQYQQFHVYQLQASRLSKLNLFNNLMAEIQRFNQQLQKWKKDEHVIRNLTVTYHLYENLFSRLMYISNFCKNQEQSMNALHKTQQWFNQQKPKLRCQVKQVSASIKTLTQDVPEAQKIDRMLQTNSIKRQLEPYQLMSRTAHPGLFPPKQQLKEYKRKQFLPFSTNEAQQNPITVKKSTSASILSKNRLSKFRMSVGTMMTTTATTSMRETRQNFKNSVTQFKIDNIPQQKRLQDELNKQQLKQNELKDQQQRIDEVQREKKVEKQQIMEQNLVQRLGQQDVPDADEQNIFEDQQIKNPKKKFVFDHDPQQIQYAKQLIKQNQQSTLRRVMRINQQKIRSKLQDLDLKRNMMIWSKVKGNSNKQQHRKLEGFLNCNKYNQIEYKKKLTQNKDLGQLKNGKIMSSTTGFSDYRTNKQQSAPTVVNMLYRSKSSHPASMQSDIQKLKIKQACKTYGRYIKHLPVPSTPQQVNEQDKRGNQKHIAEKQQMRSMSLTHLSSLVKKKHFSNILQANNPDNYNEQVQQEIVRIKTSLSKKGASIEKGTIYRALSSVQAVQIEPAVGFYTSGRDLLHNPFFPKNIGKKKKKK